MCITNITGHGMHVKRYLLQVAPRCSINFDNRGFAKIYHDQYFDNYIKVFGFN